jgi:hypothetical protein
LISLAGTAAAPLPPAIMTLGNGPASLPFITSVCPERRGQGDPGFRPRGPVFERPEIPGLVNQLFTKAGLRQRTRFFVAERRSSLLGRGALALTAKAPLFLGASPIRGSLARRAPAATNQADSPLLP